MWVVEGALPSGAQAEDIPPRACRSAQPLGHFQVRVLARFGALGVGEALGVLFCSGQERVGLWTWGRGICGSGSQMGHRRRNI